jgi:uncharacterized caspase-like protein
MRIARTLLFLLTVAAPVEVIAQQPNYWALLVGVSEYPTLGPERQLRGPRNDVRTMRDTLQGMHADWRRITTLADGVAGADGLPTRAAIGSALQQLAREVRSGDFVVIYFSGHGSQAPAARDDGEEADGFDEIFLPRDIGRWDGAAGTVRNALTDNEINTLIAPLLAAGAQVWAVFDTCHSGTITRGIAAGSLLADSETSRAVRPAELGVPLFSPRNTQAIASAAHGRSTWSEKLVVFSAAQSDESTPELRLPAGDPARTDHGLFSYTLAQALRVNGAATYAELARAIVTRYVVMQRSAPTPLFEGILQRTLPLNASAGAPFSARATPVRVSEPAACGRSEQRPPCGNGTGSPEDAALRTQAVRWLQDAANAAGSLVQRVKNPADADIALVVHSGRVWFIAPSDDYSVGARQPPSTADAASFATTLRAIVNVQRLFALAELPAARLDLSVAMYRTATNNRSCGALESAPLALGAALQTLRAGDILCMVVKNKSATSLDLTLLHVGADYSVQPLFPSRKEINRIAPGQERRIALEIVAEEKPALDRIVALAVGAQGDEIVDFSWLAQPGIATRTRGVAVASRPVWMQTLRWISAPAP